MEKSTSQKGLKVVSIITIIVAVLTILASLMILVGGGVAGTMGVDTNDQDAIMLGGLAMILGVFSLIVGVFDLIVGIMGVRVSNTPSKVKGFWVLCIVVVVLAVINALTTLGAGSITTESASSVICNLVLPILALVFATNIKKEQNL